ncbi:unnamed protein product [Rhodiola kirilowii]
MELLFMEREQLSRANTPSNPNQTKHSCCRGEDETFCFAFPKAAGESFSPSPFHIPPILKFDIFFISDFSVVDLLPAEWNYLAGEMTRVSYDFGGKKHNEAVLAASTDVLFSSRGFRSLNLGSKNKDLEVKVDPKILTMKEAVARETSLLLEQQKRLSVRDLTNKFEKGVAAAAKLSSEAKLREAASLGKHVLLKNLRDSLESLKGRVAGRNKDEVEEAINLVETLVAQLNQREGDLIQEKNEVTKLVNLLKQASENAKEFVDEERAFARAEIEKAREAVQRVEEAIQEHERISSTLRSRS